MKLNFSKCSMAVNNLQPDNDDKNYLNFFRLKKSSIFISNLRGGKLSIVMKNKIIPSIILGITISFTGFTQSAEPSSHPKLDKLFPQTESIPANTTISSTKISSGNTSTGSPSASAISKPASLTLPDAKVPETDTAKAAPAALVVIKKEPEKIVQPAPAKKPPQEPYVDTRLGSSTPQYNTYEKNNNGAGSVTTSPK